MNITTYKLIPRKALSAIFYRLSRIECTWFKNFLIQQYIKRTHATTEFAKEKNPLAYKSLNDFFTRELADGARPIDMDPAHFISPVDARCAVYGDIAQGMLLQAKSQSYTLQALLNSQKIADRMNNGKTATLYLAPDDYHRIHMPCDGTLKTMIFCPGNKHSVALDLLEKIPNIFCGNERVVLIFDTPFGELAMVLVGALNVASISVSWQGEIRKSGDNHYDYSKTPLHFKKGEEIACFNLGSTVILCWANAQLQWANPKLATGEKIRMGEHIVSKE